MNRGSILMYHVIDDFKTPAERQWCCTPEKFRDQMCWLRESGYSIASLSDFVVGLTAGKTLPPRAVCVTFDDGTKCLIDRALPVLREFQIPAMAFVVSDLIGRENDWLVKKGWSNRSLLGAADLRTLHQSGVEIGSHSATHANLAHAAPGHLITEVRDSKHRLEDVLGSAVNHFAYPFGQFNRHVVETVRMAGYESACTVESGWNTPVIDPMLLRRVEVFNQDTNFEFRMKVKWAVENIRPSIKAAKGILKRLLETARIRDRNRYSQ
ncbi:MAG: polysaccharide deacetylase family protein [Rhodoferax sp.]|nr:polysaccharide deacetylase family protein [Rhodoferax sp.]